MNILHGTWSCSLNQINKGMSKIFDTPYRKVLQVMFKKCFFTMRVFQTRWIINEKMFSMMRVLQTKWIIKAI